MGVMVTLYPHLLNSCSMLATPKATEDVTAPVCSGVRAVHKYVVCSSDILYIAPLNSKLCQFSWLLCLTGLSSSCIHEKYCKTTKTGKKEKKEGRKDNGCRWMQILLAYK